MSILVLLSVFLVPVVADPCIDSHEPCSTARSPIKVFASFSAILVLLLIPFLLTALIRWRLRKAPTAAVPTSYTSAGSNAVQLPSYSLELDSKFPKVPPPSYSPF
ncbi:hypothetical protein R3P38DRAFT_3252290 [Favolaschia claudopus]|uniref:Uncharacterized protein n=1 Tax=Favolaschia claudopus TaxID=2862362 RepID=A0AAW0DY46_9AGAR